MTVGELMRILYTLPPGQEVFLAGDEEGNCFHPLDGFSLQARTAKRGDMYNLDEVEGIETQAWHKVVVLWPG